MNSMVFVPWRFAGPARVPLAVLGLALAVAPVVGQGSAVVPARAGSGEGSTMGYLAGTCVRKRQQFLIGAPWLSALRGKDLTGLWLRRDASWPHALRGYRASLRVEISSGGRDPDRASSRFADNRGKAPVTVFAGTATLPASPALTGSPAPWTPANTLRLVFRQPFRYTGGHLCLEFSGTPSVKGYCFWPIDVEEFGARGAAASLSAACGRHAGPEGLTLSAFPASLRVGSAAILSTWGEPGAGALLALSGRTLRPPLRLAALGAPGCSLHVPPEVTLAEVLHPTPQGDGLTGWRVGLPIQPRLLGGRFYVQAIGIELGLPRARWSNALGVTTSNALALTISPSPPVAKAAIVSSFAVSATAPLPATGDVAPGRLPVLRFTYR